MEKRVRESTEFGTECLTDAEMPKQRSFIDTAAGELKFANDGHRLKTFIMTWVTRQMV